MNSRSVQDILVIGGGVVGLAISRELLIRDPSRSVTVIDKEVSLAAHASGRNSGVIHAGFYYSPESLKAQLTSNGNRMLREFCQENGVPIRNTGKLVLAVDEEEVAPLHELLRRGQANGVELEHLNQEEIRAVEPRVAHAHEAIWSPNTGVANPALVVQKLADDITRRGGVVLTNQQAIEYSNGVVSTLDREFVSGHVVNASGLYADRIARKFDMCSDYVMLPFKGLYWYAPALREKFRTLIYPVPDARNPFLGVHLTVTVDGETKVGPTAIPVLWRENYERFAGFSISELIEILRAYPKFVRSPHHDVASLVSTEVPKLIRRKLVSGLKRLVPSIDVNDFDVRGRSGIRAQLLHVKSGRLEMDFVVRGDEKSTHVLNAVSPAWTSSLSFAAHVVDKMQF